MNVLQAAFLVTMMCAAAYGQETEDPTATEAPASTTTILTVTSTTVAIVTSENVTVARNCSTTWRLPGKCVLRQLCDNNTPAIDLTLYAPRAEKRVCPNGLTCCPLDLIQTPPASDPPSQYGPDHKFEFDKDD